MNHIIIMLFINHRHKSIVVVVIIIISSAVQEGINKNPLVFSTMSLSCPKMGFAVKPSSSLETKDVKKKKKKKFIIRNPAVHTLLSPP